MSMRRLFSLAIAALLLGAGQSVDAELPGPLRLPYSALMAHC